MNSIRTAANRAYADIQCALTDAEFNSGWPVDAVIRSEFRSAAWRWYYPVVIVPGDQPPALRITEVDGTVRGDGTTGNWSMARGNYTTIRTIIVGVDHDCLRGLISLPVERPAHEPA